MQSREQSYQTSPSLISTRVSRNTRPFPAPARYDAPQQPRWHHRPELVLRAQFNPARIPSLVSLESEILFPAALWIHTVSTTTTNTTQPVNSGWAGGRSACQRESFGWIPPPPPSLRNQLHLKNQLSAVYEHRHNCQPAKTQEVGWKIPHQTPKHQKERQS